MKYFRLILLLLLSFMAFGCSPEGQDKSIAAAGDPLIDISSLPVVAEPPLEIPSEEVIDEPSVKQTQIYQYKDDFTSFNPEFWRVMEEKTNCDVSNKALIETGQLIIEAPETDRNPTYYSRPVDVKSGDIIRVKRRVFIHPGNEYANISLRLFGSSGTDLTVSSDIQTETLFTLQYLDFQYDPGRYPITKGVLLSVPGYKDSGEYGTLDPMFDIWVDEEIEYHSDSGLIRVTLNDQTLELQGPPLTLSHIRVSMNAYGWYTGHQVKVDSFELERESSGGESFIRQEKVLTRELVQPSAERIEQAVPGGISVSLPGLISSDPETLVVKSVDLNDPEHFAAVDVSLGSIHAFDAGVRITLPVPSDAVPQGEDPADYLFPVSYNSEKGEWQPEFCFYGDGTVTILSNHLSLFALESGEGVRLEKGPDSITTREEAVEMAWSSMNSKLSWGTQTHSIVSLIKDTPFMEALGKQLEKIGTGFAIIDIVKSVSQGKDMDAGLGSLKLISSWALGKFATLGTQIAGIGTFFIDYSLNTLATETIAAQQAAFDWAYRAYYKSEGRSLETWYKDIKFMLQSSSTKEEFEQALDKSIDEYVKEIWEDYAAFEGYLAQAHGHGWGGDAGLNEQIKTQLENVHKKELGQTLIPVMNRALDSIEMDAYTEQLRAAYKAKDILNQDIRFWIDVFGEEKTDQLDLVVMHEDTPMFVIQRSEKYPVDFFALMSLSDFFNGPRPTRLLLQGYLQIDEETRVPISMKKELVWDDFTQDLDFDIDRSDYGKVEPDESEEDTSDEEISEEIEIDESPAPESQIARFEDFKGSERAQDVVEARYSLFEMPIHGAAGTTTSPEGMNISFSSLSETGKAPVDPDSGEYLSSISVKDADGNGIAGATFNDRGYLEYASYIPSVGEGKAVSGDGMGNLYSEEYYKDGLLNGPSREYFDNGKISSEIYYKDGVLHGPSRSYYYDGQLEMERNYIDGLNIGLSLVYFENGQLGSKTFSKDWGAWGPYEFYYENGQLASQGQYLSYEDANGSIMGGTQSGYCRRFSPSGILIEEEWYTDEGKFLEGKYYNEAGQLRRNVIRKNGKERVIIYDENGKVQEDSVNEY